MSVPVKIRDAGEMRACARTARAEGKQIALVPTMGGLHRGHMTLLALAQRQADWVIASVFVNPAQFSPQEDWQSYPRDLSGDFSMLAEHGCDVLYCPEAGMVYPHGEQIRMFPGELAQGLEGLSRPHFFAGVVNVVCRLFHHTEPDMAVFGEKDFQQLRVIERMTQDLGFGIQILSAPIERDADGLALSTRNAYLDAPERQRAPALYRAIIEAAERVSGGEHIGPVLRTAVAAIMEAGFSSPDYLCVCDAETLRVWPEEEAAPAGREGRILAAARLGRTRLLDNARVLRPLL